MSSEECFERDLIGDTSKHDHGASLWLASAARAAISSRFGGLCGALIVILAVATWTPATLWALPVLFFALFGGKLLDGRARQAAMRRARLLPMRLPEAMDFSDDAVRIVIQRLNCARQEIVKVLGTGPRGPGFDLAGAVADVPRLERDTVVLAQRAEYVARYLVDHPVSAVAAEDRRCAEKLEREQDENRASLLRRIGAHLKARLESAMALQREYENLLDSARDTVSALEALPAKMMMLQLGRLKACHLPSALAVAEPGDVDENLQEVERALAEDPVTSYRAADDLSTPLVDGDLSHQLAVPGDRARTGA